MAKDISKDRSSNFIEFLEYAEAAQRQAAIEQIGQIIIYLLIFTPFVLLILYFVIKAFQRERKERAQEIGREIAREMRKSERKPKNRKK